MAESKARILCVGTHHKTGTVWMHKVVTAMCKRFGITFHNQRRYMHKNLDWLPETGRVIVVNWLSQFSDSLLSRPDVQIVHLIRDPRDVLISGLHYHLKNTNERFLHKPREELGGKTYQEHLRALPNLNAQFLFEMEQKHHRTMTEMTRWNYDRPNAVEWRYEDLIVDTECAMFTALMERFDLSHDEAAQARNIFWDASLFGGLKSSDPSVSSHVRSAKTAQWRQSLPPDIAEVYCERYGDDLIHLGYAQDHDWVRQINYQKGAA